MAYPQNCFAQTTIRDYSLLGRRRHAAASNTLRYQLDVLKKTGRYDAFKLHWHPSYNDPPTVWPIPNHLFWDSDIAKWIEGAAMFLKQQPDQEIEEAIVDLVDMIKSAQQPDGYINIHFTVVGPGRRFTNLRDFHELYNAGHLIEAALAHENTFHDRRLLDPMLKYVDLLCDTFGGGRNQIPGYPGHPEIELALLRLYDHTKNTKHLELANFFLIERGNAHGWFGRHYYDVEAERRGDDPNKRPAFYPERRCLWYHQAHEPIAEQQTVEGHAVRAMYLLTAATDLKRVMPDSVGQKFESAIYRLWDNMVSRKMYITGGIGAIKQWEGFGLDYFLPQGTDEGGCYSETCAAIGVMMFAERLLQIKLDGRFADTMELCLYNAVLTSMSDDGRRFTYVNQLASSDQDPSKREEWFTCACCPPNVLRLLAQIGGYLWTHKIDEAEASAEVAVHLYTSATLKFAVGDTEVQLEQQSNWPWNGDIKFNLKTTLSKLRLRLRIPGWAKSFQISDGCPDLDVNDGYVEIPTAWLASNKTFSLSIPLIPRLIAPHPFTNQHTLSLARGPIVYCVEDIDNPWVEDHFKSTQISQDCKIEERPMQEKTSGDSLVGLTITDGASIIGANSRNNSPSMSLGSCYKSEPIRELHFIPYYHRSNRGGSGQMRVGLRREAPPVGCQT
ncbi:uncharacterized protein LTR77_000784 [Saxophila tyrrhenica]|uniref:Non-reducing end beta-L-arabinofuranosidase n=1 Tax=Saxophila tyrrhenica TaxID=1690608 RepID=A0AAV9PSB2_9PEZI|nr:hypothetical protein LTR77_000784 [Saxophila tyrrhenica]